MKRLLLITCLILLAGAMLPHSASAQAVAPLPIDVCAPGFQPWDLTAKVVKCMENAIMGAVAAMLNQISNYMLPVTGIIFTFGIAVLGMRIAAGEQEMVPKATSFVLKMGLILFFSYNLGGFGNQFFAVENQLISLVSAGSPWTTIDSFLGKLVGFGPTLVLMQGLVGMIGAALFSSSAGVIMFGAGIMALLGVLFFILDIVYTYVSAMILMGFLLILSPLLIPLALFTLSERFFKRWLDLLLSVMLTPIMVFAFLSMFLMIFSPLIADIFKILGFPCANPFDLGTCLTPDFAAFWKMNTPKFAWLINNDPNVNKKLLGVAAGASGTEGPVQMIPPVQPFLNPWLKSATSASSMIRMAGIHFGAEDVLIVQKLTFAFITLFIVSSLMRSMLDTIPSIASSIAGVIVSLPLQSPPLRQRAAEAMGNLTTGGTTLIGGALGSMGGKGVAKMTGMKGKKEGFLSEVGGVLGGLAGFITGKG